MMTSPASAATTWASFSVDRPTVVVGDTFTITLTLTNTESTDISFAYQFIQPTWPLNQSPDYFTVTGCGGDVSSCTYSGKTASFQPTVPIAPGDSRSVTLTVQTVAPPNPMSGTSLPLNWAPYYYYEYGQTPGNTPLTRSQLWYAGDPSLEGSITYP